MLRGNQIRRIWQDVNIHEPTTDTDTSAYRTVDHDVPLSGGWREVYAACHVDEPTEHEGRTGVAKVFLPAGRGIGKAQEHDRGKERDWTSVSSATSGISVALDSDGAGARSGSGSRASREATMQDSDTVAPKNSSHHENNEQCDEDEPTTEVLADGGSTVRADAGTDDLPRAKIREHIQEHPHATLSGILAAVGMHPNPTATREQAAFFADLVRGRLGLDPQPASRPELGETTVVCANDGCTETEELIPHRSTAERAETWVCRECLVEAMDPSVDELADEYGSGGSA